MTPREAIQAELIRIASGGAFNESFWQALYEPSRREMQEARRARDNAVARQVYEAVQQSREAATIAEKRAARKAEQKAAKAKGAMRARSQYYHPLQDELLAEWNRSVEWISKARDVAVLLERVIKS